MQEGERKFGYSRAQVVITWIAAGHPRMALGARNALPAIVCPFHKYIVQLEEIHPINWKNTFHQLNKCIFHTAPPERVAIAVYWAVAHFHCVRNRPTLLRANLWGQVLQIFFETLNKYFSKLWTNTFAKYSSKSVLHTSYDLQPIMFYMPSGQGLQNHSSLMT